MFKPIAHLLAKLLARAFPKPIHAVLGPCDFDAHLDDWIDALQARQGRIEFEAGQAERAQIAAEWTRMSQQERSLLNADYQRALQAGRLPVGQGRYYDLWIAEYWAGYQGD